MRFTRKRLLLVFVAAPLCLTVLAIAVIDVGFLVYIDRTMFRGVSKENKEASRQYWFSPIDLPADALEVEPFNEDTAVFAKQYMDLWGVHERKALEVQDRFRAFKTSPGQAGGAGELAAIMDELEELAPLFEPLERLIHEKDYEIDAFAAATTLTEEQQLPVPDLLAVQTAAQLLHLKVLAQLREGRPHEALRAACDIRFLAKVSPYSPLVSRLISIYTTGLHIDALRDVAAYEDDLERLRFVLRWVNLAVLGGKVIDASHFGRGEFLSMLRVAKRRGLEVRLEKPCAAEILYEFTRLQGEYVKQFAPPNPLEAVQDPQTGGFLGKYGRHMMERWCWQGERRLSKGPISGVVLPEIVFGFVSAIPIPNYSEAKNREKLVRAKMALLQLETALKLHRLENGAEPASIEALVPKYLPGVRRDLFAAAGVAYGVDPTLYSVGPDGVDQGAGLLYDSTNGVASAGDVFFHMETYLLEP